MGRKPYPQIDKEKTGKRILEMMREAKLSVAGLQKKLYMDSPQGIYLWLNGKNCPSVDHLYAMAHIFHVKVDDILCGNMDDEDDAVSITQNSHLGDLTQGEIRNTRMDSAGAMKRLLRYYMYLSGCKV